MKCATPCPHSKLVTNRRYSVTPRYLPSSVCVCVHVGYMFPGHCNNQFWFIPFSIPGYIYYCFPLDFWSWVAITIKIVLWLWMCESGKAWGVWYFFMQCKDFIVSLRSKLNPFLHNPTKCHGREGYGFLFGNRNVNLFQFYCRKKLDNHPRWWCLCSCVHTLHCTWSLLCGQYFICTWRMYFFLLCVLKRDSTEDIFNL